MDNKRTLKRAYLEAPPRAGVLAIRHLPSGRLLVDGSPNAQATLNRHAFELRMKQHRNRDLQRDWDADGAAGFVFEVLDLVKPIDASGGGDAGIDPARELQALVELWREELGAGTSTAAGAAYCASACVSASATSSAMSSGLVCGA